MKFDDGCDGICVEFYGGCGEEEGDDDYVFDFIVCGDVYVVLFVLECGN